MLQMQLIQLVQIQFFSFLFTAHLKSFFSPDTFIYSLNPQISEYFQRYVTECKIFNVVSDCFFFFARLCLNASLRHSFLNHIPVLLMLREVANKGCMLAERQLSGEL